MDGFGSAMGNIMRVMMENRLRDAEAAGVPAHELANSKPARMLAQIGIKGLVILPCCCRGPQGAAQACLLPTQRSLVFGLVCIRSRFSIALAAVIRCVRFRPTKQTAFLRPLAESHARPLKFPLYKQYMSTPDTEKQARTESVPLSRKHLSVSRGNPVIALSFSRNRSGVSLV